LLSVTEDCKVGCGVEATNGSWLGRTLSVKTFDIIKKTN